MKCVRSKAATCIETDTKITHTYTHTYVNICIHTYIHTCMHAFTNIHVHAYAHTRPYARIRTHTSICIYIKFVYEPFYHVHQLTNKGTHNESRVTEHKEEHDCICKYMRKIFLHCANISTHGR
jgi:hypothetical protein